MLFFVKAIVVMNDIRNTPAWIQFLQIKVVNSNVTELLNNDETRLKIQIIVIITL